MTRHQRQKNRLHYRGNFFAQLQIEPADEAPQVLLHTRRGSSPPYISADRQPLINELCPESDAKSTCIMPLRFRCKFSALSARCDYFPRQSRRGFENNEPIDANVTEDGSWVTVSLATDHEIDIVFQEFSAGHFPSHHKETWHTNALDSAYFGFVFLH